MDNFDTNHVNNSEWKDQEAVAETELQLRRDSIQELFKGYYFNKNDVQEAPKPEHRSSILVREQTLRAESSTQFTTKGAKQDSGENNDSDESPKAMTSSRRGTKQKG